MFRLILLVALFIFVGMVIVPAIPQLLEWGLVLFLAMLTLTIILSGLSRSAGRGPGDDF